MRRLDRLLRPRSIAVIGGGTWCENVIAQCQKIGFEGAIWPVHPTRAQLGGLPAFADVAHLPDAPDASFIGVNRGATIDLVAALSDRGAGGAVCFASGFREAVAETSDGADKQTALLQAAGDMPILGPNCYGMLNYLDGAALWPDQHGGLRADSGVAIVTQSSNIAINLTMQNRGLPLAYVVTAGNQAQNGVADIARALLADARVTAIALHVEGISDLRAYEALAREAAEAGTPVIALKVGKSDQARTATVSHTASLAGSDAGASAFLSRIGIARVHSLTEMLETLKLLHIAGPLASNRIASMSCSGGEASLMADSADGLALSFPPLNDAQKQGLRAALGPKVALANPLDYHTYIWGDPAAMTATFTAMMRGDLVLGCVVLDFPRGDRCDAAAWEPVIAAVADTQAATGRQMAILASLPETMPEEIATRLTEMGIVPFAGADDTLRAIETAAWLGRTTPKLEPVLLPKPGPSAGILTEAEAKSALAAHGLRVPRAELARSPDAAAQIAEAIGFPVVLKGMGLAHKSEAGAVRLNLGAPDQVCKAGQAMPAADFLVEEMVTGGVAELLIGVLRDTAHGYVLTLGTGGVLTELMQDTTSLLVPASREDVGAALKSLRIAALLDGYRGARRADWPSIIDSIMAVQAYVQATHPQEVEINPLIATPTTAVAADALITFGDQT